MEHNYPTPLPTGTVAVQWDGDEREPYYLAIDAAGLVLGLNPCDGEWDDESNWQGRRGTYSETVWTAPARVPKVGDRVSVTLEGIVVAGARDGVAVNLDLIYSETIEVPVDQVTVIEPAFDPLAVPVRTFLRHKGTGAVYVRVHSDTSTNRVFLKVEGKGPIVVLINEPGHLAQLEPIPDGE